MTMCKYGVVHLFHIVLMMLKVFTLLKNSFLNTSIKRIVFNGVQGSVMVS